MKEAPPAWSESTGTGFGSCRGPVEGHVATEERVGVEHAEQDIGVGHGGFGAASSVRGGSGFGAGRLGADLEQAELVDPGERAAAGADLDHFDDRDAHRQTAAFPEAIDAVDLETARGERLEVVDQGKLGGGAAHVEGQHARHPGLPRHGLGQDRAAGRPGFDQPDGELRRGLQRRQAAAGGHHQERAAKAEFVQLAGKPLQVARHQRAHVSIGAGRGQALVFADLGTDLAGQRDRDIGAAPREPVGAALFMLRVDERVQVANCDALDTMLVQGRERGFQRGFIERHPDTAVTIEAFGHGQAQVARHQAELRLAEVNVARAEELLKLQAAAQVDLDTWQANRDVAVAAIAATEAQLDNVRWQL